ncbi:glycerophosphodiester phosphodiesterase family protein [Thalassomonas actiniarum]|uniref:Glycerophosphodiester phosphodiesterase family protein n=1 Tax=Thalassomonas actiniarum TaxID=485447 RepID=A0AAF0C1H3_9GAMM|nr:glycerophosphodiester phosphodiesterase family protein [Thalassomonas actiniarum]WDD96953.1 glycerophosphodiester phosphodiesterase family protein [Thalassomonas actiniarum]
METPDAGVMIVAHRACWQKAPENSLKAIDDCIALGIDIIEIDVRKSQDGVLVLMHDSTVERTTNGIGKVSELTLAQLKKLQLKTGNGQQGMLTHQRIPTFKEVLLSTKGKILINLDAKEDVFAAAIKEASSLGMEKQLIIKIEVPAENAKLSAFNFLPRTHFMPKITQGKGALGILASQYISYNPVAFEVKAKTEAYLIEGADDIAEIGARLWVNTLSATPEKAAGHIDVLAIKDPDAHWGRLVELGVGMFQTDEPEALLNYLVAKGLR